MQPEEPVINDPDDAPGTVPGADIINDPDIPADAPVDDVYEPYTDTLPVDDVYEPDSEVPDVVD